MFYKLGVGFVFLDVFFKLECMIRGMNVVFDDVFIMVKIRMGVCDDKFMV